jgi:hypothetical protein
MSVVRRKYFFANSYNTNIQNNRKPIRLLIVGEPLEKKILAKIEKVMPTEINIARNQQEAIEQRDKSHPNAIIVNLSLVDKNAFDWLLARKFNIIAIGDFENSRILTGAIAAGVKGYLWTNPSVQELVTAIQVAVKGSCYFAKGILEKQSSLFASLFPSEEKLEKLTCHLAVEVIKKWRVQTLAELPPVSDALEKWGMGKGDREEILTYLAKIDSNKSLFGELNNRLERERAVSRAPELQRGIFIVASLQQAASGLESWLFADGDLFNSGCRALVQLNAQNLRVQASNSLKQYVSEFWSITGPEPLLVWLKELENYLVAIDGHYARQHQDYCDKSAQAWHSYQNLLKKLQQSSHSKKIQELLTYAWTALESVYQFKIYTEINASASQLVAGLIQQIQSYSNILYQTNDLLLNLQKQLVEKGSLQGDTESYLAISLAEKTFSAQLRDELSLTIGNSLNRWGNSLSLTSEHLQQELLERLRPLALEIYQESCREIWQVGIDELEQKD